MSFGTLEVIVGCMSSGKSEELIRRLRRAEIAKQRVAVFKPLIDTRTDDLIASRIGQSWRATTVASSLDILSVVDDPLEVVGIDEAQFFDRGILGAVEQLVSHGKRVIVVGLDTDFLGKPFGAVPELMALADTVTKLTAVCMCCGGTATRSFRLQREQAHDMPLEPTVVVGDDIYEARCRSCHAQGLAQGITPSA